jgi:hypothetical protein
MRAKMSTAMHCRHTLRFAVSTATPSRRWKIRRRFAGMDILFHFASRGKRREHARKVLRTCFGRVEKIFRLSQVVFRGPHNDDLLFIGDFDCQEKNSFVALFPQNTSAYAQEVAYIYRSSSRLD